MKFEEALSTYDNRVYSIDEIFWLYHNDKTAYAQCLYGTLICPECKEAALSFNNAKVPYFKAYPNSAHGEHCSLRQEELDSLLMEKIVDAPVLYGFIQQQMNNILNQILLGRKHPIQSDDCAQQTETKIFQNVKLSSTVATKRLPRKRIDISFSSEDFNCYKVFYGHALL